MICEQFCLRRGDITFMIFFPASFYLYKSMVNILQQIADPEENYPIPAMAGHTLTLVDDTKLWLIGGFSSPDYFSELVYEYDASDNSWEEMDVSGSTPTG